MERFYSLTDRQFALLEPILQDARDARGRKPKIPDRHVMEAVLYILREGCRWRDMPEFFGHWMLIFMRYKRWIECGVWWKVLMRLQKFRVLKVHVVFMDGGSLRVPRHAAAARKSEAA